MAFGKRLGFGRPSVSRLMSGKASDPQTEEMLLRSAPRARRVESLVSQTSEPTEEHVDAAREHKRSSPMFEVCLFDLDQTLIDTEDMTALREAGKGRRDASYTAEIRSAFGSADRRLIYPEEILKQIRAEHPRLKLGVFTRSPRSYATTILALAYPQFEWDVIVAYEDVRRTKPYGEGIDKAMSALGCENTSRVLLVGDGDSDLRAAYNAGCVVALDKSSWAKKYTKDNWNSLSHIPDIVISKTADFKAVLKDYQAYLPELERLLAGGSKKPGGARFDRVNKFIHRDVGGDNTAFPVFTGGRSFAGYASLERRTKWHKLTKSIHEQKEATSFPEEWVQAVRSFISSHYLYLFLTKSLIVTVIPHRPGRTPRLEFFLAQLEASLSENSLGSRFKFSFVPNLLAYKEGVRSNSNEKLGPKERFENIRDHLYVNRPEIVKGSRVLVIDDVSTTGSSLIYAKKYLDDCGALDVTCFSIAMNISNVLYD